MNISKRFLALSIALMGMHLSFSQSIPEALKALNYAKLKTAEQIYTSLLAKQPADENILFGLAQVYIQNERLDLAKNLLQKALQEGINKPLIIVGQGEIDLFEGRTEEAKQKFDQALFSTKNKKGNNPTVLNAIGRANAMGGSKIGIPSYAIPKLQEAIQLDPKNSSNFIYLGILDLKEGGEKSGGNAYEAFNNALSIEPNNPIAKYRLGLIFLSQNNIEKFEEYFQAAIKADSSYPLPYLALYNYYAERDVTKAKIYLDNYVRYSDKDCNTAYFYADYLFRSHNFQESIDAANAMKSGDCKDYARANLLLAYNYDRLNDSIKAQFYLDSYFSKELPEKIIPQDYLFAGTLYNKIAGQEANALKYLQKAYEADTLQENRIKNIYTIASIYRGAQNYAQEYVILNELPKYKKELSNRDMYYLSDAAINANQFPVATDLANQYLAKYPEQEFGYVLRIKAAKKLDADTSKLLAFAPIEDYLKFLYTDSVKNIAKIKTQYYYMASIASDKLKNYAMALDFVNRILAVDSTDEFGKQAKPVLEQVLKPRAPKPSKPAATTPSSTPANKPKKTSSSSVAQP